MAKKKKYSELRFTDDFMFCKIMVSNPELCKELLELILDVKIKKIVFLDTQKTIEIKYDGHGIRLDVYLEDDKDTVYDLEMQTTEKRDLPKRTRYYQGMIDINLISRGTKYRELKKSYIIFICLSDPFKKNLPIYTFESKCNQNDKIILGDDAYKVIINAAGNRDGLSKDMTNFLDFLQGKGCSGILPTKIDSAVKDAIEAGIWKEEYMMTWDMKIAEEREDAAIEMLIRSGIRHDISDEKIIEDLISDFQFKKEEAVKVLEDYKKELHSTMA